jgi:hypothetical protein
MNILIIKPFLAPGANRAFEVSECLTVPDKLAAKWIAEGRAISLDQKPTKPKRETATR